MLTKEKILMTLRNEINLGKYNIKSLALFGSFSRDEQNDESDIDLLYTFKSIENISHNRYTLNEDLEKIFGRDVHLLPEKYIDEYMLDCIRDELIYV